MHPETETMRKNKGGIICRFVTINAVLLSQISDDTIEKLRQIFLSLDDDNSGTLSARELRSFGKMNIFESLVCTTTLACDMLSVLDRNEIGLQWFTYQELYIGVQWFSAILSFHQLRWRRLMKHWSAWRWKNPFEWR